MKKEMIICDVCSKSMDVADTSQRSFWFTAHCPRDLNEPGSNDFTFKMDVCPSCRICLHDAITSAIEIRKIRRCGFHCRDDSQRTVESWQQEVAVWRKTVDDLKKRISDLESANDQWSRDYKALSEECQAAKDSAGAWQATAEQAQRNTDYYAGLLDKIGNTIGEEAFIADDGVKHDSVLRAKLPRLVEQLKERVDYWRREFLRMQRIVLKHTQGE